MKFLDYLFHGKQMQAIDSYFKMLNGYSPTFTSFNGGVYASSGAAGGRTDTGRAARGQAAAARR